VGWPGARIASLVGTDAKPYVEGEWIRSLEERVTSVEAWCHCGLCLFLVVGECVMERCPPIL